MIMKSIAIGTTLQRLCTPIVARAEPRSEFVVGGECSGQTLRTGQHPASRHVSFVQYSRNIWNHVTATAQAVGVGEVLDSFA